MKKLSKIIFAAACVLLIAAVVPLSRVARRIGSAEIVKPAYNSIIEVWQLDMVEGGKGSRTAFLKSAAKRFESARSGVIVSVTTETKFGAEEKMKRGIFPDVISFSCGLVGFETSAAPLDFGAALGGEYGGRTYAAAWAVGGYAIITKKNCTLENVRTLYISQNEYNLPLAAYYLSDVRIENLEVRKPTAAYTEFLSSENAALLGTQRDLYRLRTRGVEYDALALTAFSDVVQYAAVVSANAQKRETAKQFVKMLSELPQDRLEEIGMLSPKGVGEMSADSPLGVFAKLSGFRTISVFSTPESISALNAVLAGGADEKEKLSDVEKILQ